MAASTQPAKPAESNMTQDSGLIPPLENGDRLTRAEFERRYDAMPELKKALLVEGEVYMPSPVRHGRHSHPHTRPPIAIQREKESRCRGGNSRRVAAVVR